MASRGVTNRPRAEAGGVSVDRHQIALGCARRDPQGLVPVEMTDFFGDVSQRLRTWSLHESGLKA